VKLDVRHFKTIADFEVRIPVAPSLREARSFTVDGAWSLGSDVTVSGDVHLEDEGSEQRVPDGARLLG
jgi:UTP--glucose-1-phosphate uridylyltransferase